jgi:large subunit ribosomal protein L23
MKTLALQPRMSEKAYAASLNLNTYVFTVPISANKALVSAAVAEQFSVTVEDVRLAVVKGKSKKSYKKRARPVDGKRANTKKAYVRLKAGDSIAIFEATEEPKETIVTKAVKKASEKAAEKSTEQPKQGRIRQALGGKSQRQTQSKGSGGK